MLIAISRGSIGHGLDLLSPEEQERVFRCAADPDHLITPFGLRTLSRNDPRYGENAAGPDAKRIYQGWYHTDWPTEAKDLEYHQGTVWPWLIGPFIDALWIVRTNQGVPEDEIRKEIRHYLAPLVNFPYHQPLCFFAGGL